MTYDTINDAVTMQGGGGTLLAGRYRVVRQLGQGGMGSVWLAEDAQLDNKQFAIKMLPSILVSNKRAYRQLKDEALVAMKLAHPNIVNLRAFEENNGNPFLVMDYVDGETLDNYLSENDKLSEDETIRLLKPIAAALDYAHLKGVVHRDVKPGNVMVAKDGTPYILDFGIAREMQETMTRVTGKLSSGTLLYMSPEQLNGDSPRPAQDVYSFAAMVYECLRGEPPFTRGAIEDQIKNKSPEPLRSDDAPVVANAVMAGLSKKPEDRPETCEAVLHSCRKAKGKNGKDDGDDRGIGKVLVTLLLLTMLVVGGFYGWRAMPMRGGEKGLGGVVPHETSDVSETNDVVALTNDPPKLLPTNTVNIVDGGGAHGQLEDEEKKKGESKKKDQAEHEARVAAESARENALTAEPAPSHATPPPEFVKMTNRLAVAVCERNLEYGKANSFRDSSRGFASRLDRVDNASNRWTKVKGTYAPDELGEVRDALNAIENETKALRKEIDWMSDNISKRDVAVSREKEFCEFCTAEKRTNAVLFARAEKRQDWKSVLLEVGLAKNNIDKGLFDDAKRSYAGLGSRISEILEDERKKIAEEKFLVDLGAKGFIQDDKSNKYQPGMEKSISLPGGESLALVWCPPGWFMMGSPVSEMGRNSSEGVERRHAVWIRKGFWIGKYEVTGDQWKSVMGSMPESQSEADSGWFQGVVNTINSGEKPVTGVSYDQCEEFCSRLPAELGAGLPTEAEWEYACRAGTQTAYSLGRLATGKIINSNMANVEAFGGFLKAAGCYKDYSNMWGICDMHGNAREWCADGYGIFSNVDSLSVNPLASPDSFAHVVKGGACNESADRCRCAARSSGKADQYTGFRIRCYNLP